MLVVRALSLSSPKAVNVSLNLVKEDLSLPKPERDESSSFFVLSRRVSLELRSTETNCFTKLSRSSPDAAPNDRIAMIHPLFKSFYQTSNLSLTPNLPVVF